MIQRNLLFNEIEALQINRELEFEVKKDTVTGHVAWAKTILNKLLGTSLTVDNKSDESLKKSLAQFQAANDLNVTSKLDFKTERALLEKNALANLSDLDRAKKEIIIQAKTKIEDWTSKAVIVPAKKHLILNQFRDPRILTALVLHHMAVKARDKNKQYSNPEMYVKVGAHFCIMMDGRIMQHHPISRFIWHSNCTSPRSVGVEFEGNFPSIKGKWWYPRDEKTGKLLKINEDVPTQAQFEAGRFLVSYLKLLIGLKHVLAHRQSSDTRENDPGPDIWFNVGEWALANLDISDGGKDFKCGTGNPILKEWRTWNKVTQKKENEADPSVLAAFQGESPSIQNTVQANRVYGEKLGWFQHLDKINDLLLPFSGLSNVSLGEEAFAEALIKWQQKQGLEADGKLGPKTWEAVKQALSGGGGKTSSTSSSSTQGTKYKEIINGKAAYFVQQNPGWKVYGGGDLKEKLKDLANKGLLSITQNEIDYFYLVSQPEASGLVNVINSWDDAYLSMGFFQFTIKYGELQKVIAKAPETFGKYGIELDAPRKYVLPDEQPIAIKNAAKISELRSEDWAKRFYLAGLDDDIIIAQIKVAQETLNRILKNCDPNKYLNRFTGSYPNVWAFIFEGYNSRPAPLQTALKNAIKKAANSDLTDPVGFGRILVEELLNVTRNYYGQKIYDQDPAANEIKKNKRINSELAKVGRIIEKTKLKTN